MLLTTGNELLYFPYKVTNSPESSLGNLGKTVSAFY